MTVAFAFFVSFATAQERLILSQEMVAERVVQQSLQAARIQSSFVATQGQVAEVEAAYDWLATAASGYRDDNTESLSSQAAIRYKRLETSVGVSKSFSTGTRLTLGLSRLSQTTVSGPATAEPQLTADRLELELSQDLLRNAFGSSDRSRFRQAEAQERSYRVLRAHEMQELVLTALRSFWSTCVADRQLKAAIGTRERYATLVKNVRRKSSLGFAGPGELAQTQAEFETREQNVKVASLTYLTEINALRTIMNIHPRTEVECEVPKDLPPPPDLAPIGLENLRTVKAQEQKLAAAQALADRAEDEKKPRLRWVGQLASSGVDPSARDSSAEALGGDRPMAYTGLELEWLLGSDARSRQSQATRAAAESERLRLELLKRETQDRLSELERNVLTSLATAKSAVEQNKFRQIATDQLNKSYRQGRTDISVLIDAMNKMFDAEIAVIRSIGRYHVARNELAAARDELISEEKGGQ